MKDKGAVFGMWLWFFNTRAPWVQAKLGARFHVKGGAK